MEIITMESAAYKELIEKIERIALYIHKNEERQKKKDKPDIWLTGREVMSLLNISVRTLQRLRESERVSYAIFRGACRYRLSEIERLVSESDFIINAKNLETFKRNFHLRTQQVNRKLNNKD